MSEDDLGAMQFLEQFTASGGLAYNAYQSAQPQTLAYALQDSPAGWPQRPTYTFWRSGGRPTAQWTRPGATAVVDAPAHCH